jgi:hypothetical protein
MAFLQSTLMLLLVLRELPLPLLDTCLVLFLGILQRPLSLLLCVAPSLLLGRDYLALEDVELQGNPPLLASGSIALYGVSLSVQAPSA